MRGHFEPGGHYLNKVGRGLLADASYPYVRSRLCLEFGLEFVLSEKKILKDVSMKTYKPRGVAIVGQGVIILTNLVEGHWVIIHTKHQSSKRARGSVDNALDY